MITEIITTGLNFKYDRIVHISIITIDNSGIIQNELTTYINPERTVEQEWSRSVGISQNELAQAPKFFEKAKSILELFADGDIISSNPRFTYTFIKNEFKRLGYDFNHKYRQLNEFISKVPEIPTGIEKARSIAGLIQEEESIIQSQGTKKDLTPIQIVDDMIKIIPNATGVYLLKNQSEDIIYVGKAIKIRTRVRQHFRNLNNKGFAIHRKVAAIDWVETRSEMIALLLELHLIQEYRPELNKALRNNQYQYGLFVNYDGNEAKKLILRPIGKALDSRIIKRFRSRKSGMAYILDLFAKELIIPDQVSIHRLTSQELQHIMEAYSLTADQLSAPSLSNTIREINPFFSGRYMVSQDPKFHGYALIENGQSRGISLKQYEQSNFSFLEKNLEFKLDHPNAINIVIGYQKSNNIHIKKFDI